jgi:hypothetical protein
MKKMLTLICTGVLMSALCAAFVACNDEPDQLPPVIMPDPYADCAMFAITIPGKEKILLATRGITHYDALDIHKANVEKYGEGNVSCQLNFPNGINDNGLDYLAANPGDVTNCYEITITTKLADFVIPSPEQLRRNLLDGGVSAVMIADDIAIYKTYDWAFTEERAEELMRYHEKSFYERVAGIGTHVKTTIKNLGPEIHNEPVIF